MYNNYYQQQPQQQQYMPQRLIGLKGRPVASIEEVKAAPIDFDGSITYFPDLTNNKIYTKQINIDGSMSLLTYELSEKPVEPKVEYVTKEEFEKAIAKLTNSKVASKF